MKLTRHLTGFGLIIALCLPLVAAEKAKDPADGASEEFFKLREDKAAKPGPARFQQLVTSGVNFITQYPSHRRAGAVISALATFGSTMKDKNQASLRASWLPALKLELVNQRYNEKLGEEAKAAVAALEAAVAGMEAREAFSRDSLAAYREKIDALAKMPAGSRFLFDQEREYLELLNQASPKNAEEQARKLAEHADKKFANLGRDQLNLAEIRKQPYELKFTAVDGKPVDVSRFRGKILMISFWSVADDESVKEQMALRDAVAQFRNQIEVVGVAYDTAEDREKVLKSIKSNNLSWTHHVDGKASDVEFGEKLAVRNLPTVVLFDQKGMMVARGRVSQLAPEVKKLLAKK